MVVVTGPVERLRIADRLLAGDYEEVPEGVRPRAVVWLLRLALERALDELWAARRPEVAGCNRAAQFLVLVRFVDPARAARAAFTWSALSQLAHHDDYELAPTVAELRQWQVDTNTVVAMLRDGAGPAKGGPRDTSNR